ncbi:unnamed protein product [Strongylus vulgaris]|uniref:Uncharacterized protein n=1 Tax=Strongylus vulgaris TaxID=40348 RepID=A0A3P7M2U2_STRVU|nr:unnamed protein product [Strongylus vulgaris]
MYFDEAPCMCPTDECPAVELHENLIKENCTPGAEEVLAKNDFLITGAAFSYFTLQTFAHQAVPKENTLFYSTKRMVLGRVVKCDHVETTVTTISTVTTTTDGNSTEVNETTSIASTSTT